MVIVIHLLFEEVTARARSNMTGLYTCHQAQTIEFQQKLKNCSDLNKRLLLQRQPRHTCACLYLRQYHEITKKRRMFLVSSFNLMMEYFWQGDGANLQGSRSLGKDS